MQEHSRTTLNPTQVHRQWQDSMAGHWAQSSADNAIDGDTFKLKWTEKLTTALMWIQEERQLR